MLLVTLTTILLLSVSNADKTDVSLTTGQMIENHGYPSEYHTVTTEDGYILTLNRIPYGINNNDATQKPPVLLVHGFISCAAEFISLGPERGLGYILADAGYDVWLLNTRGTTPSRNHTSINVETDPDVFYNFTWHEIGIFDVSASIDYILDVNGDDGVYYVGHSQGTTVFLVLTSMRPEYNSKIKLASLMAPAAIVKHYQNIVVQDLVLYLDEVWNLFQKYGIWDIPYTTTIRETATTLCVDYPEVESDPLCDFLYNLEIPAVARAMLAIVFSNCPSNSGLKQYVHYGQLVRDGGFRQWDFGTEGNLQVYGSETPPDYDLTQVVAPVALYYAPVDSVITVEDENVLYGMLPNVILNYLVPDETFGHIDFAMNDNVVALVYDTLLSVMEEYEKKKM